ncbi:MAG: NAD regulator [Hyphomicrobiaceae bacterium]|nr:NAD regulator [Hyphomicrobiaceae bacterium]
MTVELTAVVVSVQREQPLVLATGGVGASALPTARFNPNEQPSLETALREAVLAATGRETGFLEQLSTHYEPSASAGDAQDGSDSCLLVSYLGLARADDTQLAPGAGWIRCYDLLPWEDFRSGRPAVLGSHIMPALAAWADAGIDPEIAAARHERLHIAFAFGGRTWDDQRVVDRLDLIVEAGVTLPSMPAQLSPAHVRLVAAGLGRLRAKIRYRPVVFELLSSEFTLFELQRTVEAVLGPTLHKQNFRRLVEGTGLVEPTGDVRTNTGGRPAKTFRFRREVLLERPAPGVHVRPGRAA